MKFLRFLREVFIAMFLVAAFVVVIGIEILRVKIRKARGKTGPDDDDWPHGPDMVPA